MEFRRRRDRIFADNLAGSISGQGKKLLDGDYDSYMVLHKPSFVIKLKEPRRFNRILLQEYIPLGQRISSFTVEAEDGGTWKEIARGTTVGYKRILRIPETSAGKVRITVTGAKAVPVLSEAGLYLDD